MDMDMQGVERGCGVREPGGIYFETPHCRVITDRCRPVDDFLFDPPLPLGNLDVPNRGVLIMERPDGSGVHDVYDRVGESGYPNVADMIEEIRQFGLSRRAGKGLDFGLLGPGSLIFLIHPRAIITNATDAYRFLANERDENPAKSHPFRCPCRRANHRHLPDAAPDADGFTQETCAGLWYELLTNADANYDLDAPRRSCTRRVGSTVYSGRSVPHDFTPDYAPGIFARFPISRLAVVADPEGTADLDAHKRLETTHLPVVDVYY